MPVPTERHIEEMGSEVYPFERKNNGSKVGTGENIIFENEIYNATEDGKPENVIIVSREEIETNPLHGKYLWIINKSGLLLILEATPNTTASRGCVCHTNITGGAQALQGGELWFGENDQVYINFKSARYGGNTTNQWIGVNQYFRYVGYSKINILL